MQEDTISCQRGVEEGQSAGRADATFQLQFSNINTGSARSKGIKEPKDEFDLEGLHFQAVFIALASIGCL